MKAKNFKKIFSKFILIALCLLFLIVLNKTVPENVTKQNVNKLDISSFENFEKLYIQENKSNSTEQYNNRPIIYYSKNDTYSEAVSFDGQKRFFTTLDSFEYADEISMPSIVNFNLYSSDIDGSNIQHIKKITETPPYLHLIGANYAKGELYFKSTGVGWDFIDFVVTDLEGDEVKRIPVNYDSPEINFKNNNTILEIKPSKDSSYSMEISLIDFTNKKTSQ